MNWMHTAELKDVFFKGQERFCRLREIEQPYRISRTELYAELREHIPGEDKIEIWDMVMGWWFPSRTRTERMKLAFLTSPVQHRIQAHNFNMYLLRKWEGRTDEHI